MSPTPATTNSKVTPKEIPNPKVTGVTYYLGTIGSAQQSDMVWRVPLMTNGRRVSYKVDTGAQVSILPKSVYNQLPDKPSLRPTTARLLPYGSQEPLSVDGQCVCSVTMDDGRSRYLRFLVVPYHDEPLLGLGASEHLGLLQRTAALRTSTAAEEPLLEGLGLPTKDTEINNVAQAFPDISDGLGCLKEFPYQIQLGEKVQPVAIDTPRRVPFPLHLKVKEELARMARL